MSDRFAGFIVTLDVNLRSDDAEQIRNLLGAIKHVVSVEPIVTDCAWHTAHAQARHELGQRLWEVLYPKVTP